MRPATAPAPGWGVAGRAPWARFPSQRTSAYRSPVEELDQGDDRIDVGRHGERVDTGIGTPALEGLATGRTGHGVLLADRADAVSIKRVRPVSASSRGEIPASGSWSSRGSTTRRAIVSWRVAPRRHDPAGSSLMKSLITTSMARRAVRRTRASPALSLVLGEAVGVATRARTSCDRWRTPPAGGSSSSITVADQNQAHPVAVLDGRCRQERRGLGRSIGLGCPLATEPHARRDVDHQPER